MWPQSFNTVKFYQGRALFCSSCHIRCSFFVFVQLPLDECATRMVNEYIGIILKNPSRNDVLYEQLRIQELCTCEFITYDPAIQATSSSTSYSRFATCDSCNVQGKLSFFQKNESD